MERYNPWWRGEEDEKYTEWKEKKIRWTPKVVGEINLRPFSLHFLVGPRQVGKTTALKLLIYRELAGGRDPGSIFYYQCDELSDYRELGEVVDAYLESARSPSLIILDEITFAEEWWRAVKARIDLGRFKNSCLIISGSASIELLKEKERFPGRRGMGQDFTLLPLSLKEYLELFRISPASGSIGGIRSNMRKNLLLGESIERHFRNYLVTGGFPLPIEDFYKKGRVSFETRRSYMDSIRGDMRKIGKSEKSMKEVISYLIRARASPISWLSVARNTSFASPHTAQSYVEALESLFVLSVLNLILPDSKVMYRKNRKVHFTDPFIAASLAEYAGEQVYPENMLEGLVASHLARRFPVYYWRNGSECDIVGTVGGRQVGFEVKMTKEGWRKPRHIREAFLLTRKEIPLFLASLK